MTRLGRCNAGAQRKFWASVQVLVSPLLSWPHLCDSYSVPVIKSILFGASLVAQGIGLPLVGAVGIWVESLLLCFPSNTLLVLLGRQQRMAQVPGLLLFRWVTWTEFWAPGLCQDQPQ